MSGLDSLTANYTASEDEDDVQDEDTRDSLSFSNSGPPSNSAIECLKSATPKSDAGSDPITSARSTPKKLSLVSYELPEEDEVDVSDSLRHQGENGENVENQDTNAVPVPMELESDVEEQKETEQDRSLNKSLSSRVQVDAWTEGGKLPPEVEGLCSPRIQDAVNKAMQKKKDFGYDMNAAIQKRKTFRNPSIYEKLIEFCDIDEHGTNFPKDLYDGHLFYPESDYEELQKAQKIDMARREKLLKERSEKGEKRSNSSSNASDKVPSKRKSKWDQVGHQQVVPVIRSSVPDSANKTIPAFGALKKVKL